MARSSSGALCSSWVGCKLPPGGGDVQGDGRQLGRHGHGDHGRDADVVQHPQQPAAQKPENAEQTLKNAVARGAAGLWHHAGDRSFQDGLLRAHADAPEGDAKQQHRHAVRAEDEDGKRCGQERGPHERAHALFIVHHAENERCDRLAVAEAHKFSKA